MPEEQVPLREHIEALLAAHQLAEEVAERERSRAAQVLAEGLERSIISGDIALRDHVAQQINQIQAALKSADNRLEAMRAEMVLRDATVRDLLNVEAEASNLRVREAFAASEKAIAKAEAANEKRFECVAADTPILCADLVWRPAGDLVEGDEIVAFDEESPTRRGRMFRHATVTANSLEQDALIAVETPFGSVRCNPQHPWLARHAGEHPKWEWINTADLRVGDDVLRPLDPWETGESWDTGWLAGMFDGEGCLCLNKNGGVQLSVTQRESETSDRLARVLAEHLGHEVRGYHTRGREDWSEIVHFIVSARADVLALLGGVRPPRLLPRARGVWEGKPIGGHNRVTTVTALEQAGTGTIAALSTSTATYIAAGFAMHNSVNAFREQLADQASHFLPREVADTQFGNLLKRIEANTDALGGMRGTYVTKESFDARVGDLTKQISALTESLGKLT